MKNFYQKLSALILIGLLIITATSVYAQFDSQNCTLIGRWAEGDCYDVLANGNIVYFGNGAYLQIMDFTDPVNPNLLGRIALPSMVRGLALSDNKMYVANYNGGLRIVDVSNPAAPVEIGALEKIGTAYDLVIDGSYAYVAGGNAGLIIVAISDPAKPTKVGQLDLGTTPSVAVSGNYAYTCFGKVFMVVDISDRTRPSETARIDLPDYSEEVTIQGSYAYVANNKGGLRIIDVANPASPTEVGLCLENKRVFGVKVVNSTAYIASYQYGFYVYDISMPSNPVELGLLQNLKYIRHIAIQNDRAYVAQSSQGMSTINIATASAPVAVSNFKTGTYWEGLDVQGNYAYLTGGENIRIIDCAEMMNPTSISFFDAGNYDCYDLVVRDNYAYLAASWFGLEIIDITSPANPVIIGHTSNFDWSQDVAVSGNYAYVADYGKGVRIVDITNPQSPTEVGSYDTRGKAYSVAVQEPYAFVADYDSGLCIVNVADVRNPFFVAQIKSTYYTMGVAARDNNIFVADGDSIKIFDISNSNNPLKIGACPAYGFARQIQVAGDYAFVANGTGGAAVFDISNLQTPNRIGYYITGDDVNDIAVKDNLIFALDGMVGLYIIRFDAPTNIDRNPTTANPLGFSLSQNYPNPFNPITHFNYQVPSHGKVRIAIYNLNGQLIRTIIDREQLAGNYAATWDGTSDDGNAVVTGVYLIRMEVGNQSASRKILYLK